MSEDLHQKTFSAPEAWSVEVATDAGIEGRGFLLAEGRSTDRMSLRTNYLPAGQKSVILASRELV